MNSISKKILLRNSLQRKSRLFSVSSRLLSEQSNVDDNRVHGDYRHASSGSFIQAAPILRSPYTSDGILQSYLRRHLPKEHFAEVDSDLRRFGEDIISEIDDHGRQCELHPPTLTRYDAWGGRVDRVNTCTQWKMMKSIAAREGVVAHGYKRDFGRWSRLYQMAKMLMFAPSSGLYSCPLAMVDGAAKVMEIALEDRDCDNSFLKEPFKRLTSEDPGKFWTSGQWMTEKGGGSDVAGGTDTFAYKQDDGSYKLYGCKWFTSATDADMALTLARIVDKNGITIPGSKGLSLFYLETRDPKHADSVSGLNGIQILRLKDKLGTRQLPTSELILDGATAHLIGKTSFGVRTIAGMLTITRIHNSIASVGGMRHILLLSKDYATKRKVFGTLLCDHAIHMQTLARMETETRAAFLLVFEIVRLLGFVETCEDDCEDENNLIRLLTPICKLYTAKQAVSVASEGLESFGGAGYLEDTGLPMHLRDAQVLSIWEGTTNVLSLDALRAVAKSRGEVLNSYFKSINDRLTKVSQRGRKELRNPTAKIHVATGDLRAFISQASAMNSDAMMLAGRDFSYSLARTYMAMLLLEQAAWEDASDADLHAVTIWCGQDLCPVATGLRVGSYSEKASRLDRELVFESFEAAK